MVNIKGDDPDICSSEHFSFTHALRALSALHSSKKIKISQYHIIMDKKMLQHNYN